MWSSWPFFIHPKIIVMAKRKKQHQKKKRKSKRTRPMLSLCMIAKDEADFLSQCMASVKGLVDEVVIGDTGSSDETVSIARKAGARVFDVAWTGDFSVARNTVMGHARGAWILVLDCDEVVAPQDHVAICNAMASKNVSGFRMTTRNYVEASNRAGWQACDGGYDEEKNYRGWFPTTKVRLFRNDSRIRFEGALHELVEGTVEKIGGAIADLAVPVHHYGYVEKDRDDDMYALAAQKKADGDPQNAEASYQLALSLRDAGKFEQAREAIEVCIGLMGQDHADHGHYLKPDFVYLVWGEILSKLNDRVGEEKAYLKALGENELSYHALNNLGALKQRTGELQEALAYYQQAVVIAPEVEAIGENVRRVRELLNRESHIGNQSREVELQESSETDVVGDGGRLTLCMIAGNEGHRLGKCLESVKGLVDEIVVVDTGSTDNTVEIAKEYGATLGYFEWCDDFAAARNESLKLATGDWIMWLDPDDILPRECHAKIRSAMQRGLGKNVAYYWILDDQGYEPVTCLQMRLFPNVQGLKFTMPIHEQITPSLAELGVRTEATDIRVEHTGYSSPEVVDQKQVKYLRIMESWLEKYPDDYIVRSHAAMTYYIRGRLQESIEAYQKILADGRVQQDKNLVIQTTATLYLGRCFMRLKQYDDALPYLLDAQKLDDQYAVTNLTLGECYTRMNRAEDAIVALDQALAFENQVTFSATDPVALQYSIRFFKGQNLEALGQLEDAIVWYKNASEIDKTRGGAHGRLSSVYRRLGMNEDAVMALETALQCEPDNAQHRFNRGTFYLEAGEMDHAVRWFKKALESDPTKPEPYLNLGYVARRQGDVKTAEEMYQRAIERSRGGYDAQANLGHLLLDQERFVEAGILFETVRKQQTGLLDITLGLCVVRASAGALADVRAYLGEVLQAVYGAELSLPVPDNALAADVALLLAEAGRMLVQQQQIMCAKLAYWAAYCLDQASLDIALQLAAVYQATDEHWKAVSIYEGLIQMRPTDPELFEKLGVCYEAMGVAEAAQLCSEQIATLKQ